MRIVIDLQAAQASSRHRGMGRYSLSLAKAIAKNRGNHELLIALNSSFPETITDIRKSFLGLLPIENIRVWESPDDVSVLKSKNPWRRECAELVREAFLANLKPDIIHVSSLFEGLADSAVTSIKFCNPLIPTTATLYDLIPLLDRKCYLQQKPHELWYENKLAHLKRANLLLAISEASRQDAINFLNINRERVVNVSAAAEAHFRSLNFSAQDISKIYKRYSLKRPFVMYICAQEHRKNESLLIHSYAQLSENLRSQHQLVIIGSQQNERKQAFKKIASECGLREDELIFTDFIPEYDLIAFYNLCKVFVFPSLYEGFGLPVLEAMCCGKPVICSNTSSLPEVIGWPEACFDPHSKQSLTDKLEQVLNDDDFRNELTLHCKNQAKLFSWDKTAKRAIAAFESLHKANNLQRLGQNVKNVKRLKLAYVSPLPPLNSNVAKHSTQLITALLQYYDIDIITNQKDIIAPSVEANCHIRNTSWFKINAGNFDRVLYHFDNSSYHSHMFDLLNDIPGIVILNDFHLGSALKCKDDKEFKQFFRSLYLCHGYKALFENYQTQNNEDIIRKYPCNLSVLQNALGVIFHSEHILELAKKWYGVDITDKWYKVPLVPEFFGDVTTIRKFQPQSKNQKSDHAEKCPNECLRLSEYSDLYKDAIENIYFKAAISLTGLYEELSMVADPPDNEMPWMELAQTISLNIPAEPRERQLLVDISELVARENYAGIHRVVRNILYQLLNNPPTGFRVEPVYTTIGGEYRYARQFTLRFNQCSNDLMSDQAIEYQHNDVFLGLDLLNHISIQFNDFYRFMHNRGVKIYFVIYDILPLLYPAWFQSEVGSIFETWLPVVSKFDGLICISRTVAQDVSAWLNKFNHNIPAISYFHLGADLNNNFPTPGSVTCSKINCAIANGEPTFLMVGTVEPRKGHNQMLETFNILWSRGIKMTLLIVGKKGWHVEGLISKIKNHDKFNKNLFWLDSAGDDSLQQYYNSCSCLLAASEGEGFGLPLIEASKFKLPIVARDIPVFREIAGNHAFYFSNDTPESIADELLTWLDLFNAGEAPSSSDMPCITWEKSAQQLMSQIL